jgi:hypothetical protein
VKTKGENRLFGPDRDLPNLESAESEMRDLGETKIGEGNTENQHLIQEEEDETTGEQQNPSFPVLADEKDADTSMKGKNVVVGERFVEEIMGKQSLAGKNGFGKKSQKEEDLGAFMAAAKGRKNPPKSGSVYVGQWNKIKEKMEWSLTEGGIDGICHNVGATSPILESMEAAKSKEKLSKYPDGGQACNAVLMRLRHVAVGQETKWARKEEVMRMGYTSQGQ